MNEHEEKTIAAFILKERQERYRFLLGNSNPRKRNEGLDRLNHCADFNLKYVMWLHSNADVTQLLRQEGSPEKVYVISDTKSIDGKVLPLAQAIEEAESGGWGTIISCVAGQLAYYYGEHGESRAILKRKPRA